MQAHEQPIYRLRVLSPDMLGVEFLVDRDEITIGRLADNDVCLPLDLRASRRHARLLRVGDNWLLEDLGSANGTYSGQLRVHNQVAVSVGDQIRVGRTWLELVAEEAPAVMGGPKIELVSAPAAAPEAPEVGENVLYSVDAEAPAAPRDDLTAPELQEQLQALSDASMALSQTLELDQVLNTAMDQIMHSVPAERGFLLLAEGEELAPRVTRSGPSAFDGTPITLSRSIVERAARERRVILSSDASTDERFAAIESVHDFQIRSVICAPLVRRGEVLGVLFLDSASGNRIFTERDVDLVSAITAQAASALENARLYTQLRQAYRDLEETQEQLVRTEKLSTIGTLAASLAHDMSNILSPLAPLVQLMAQGQEVPDEAKDIMRREIRRLGALVQQLYSFSEAGPKKFQPVQVNEVLQDGIALLTTEARHRGVELETSLAEDLPPINADPDQVYRAVLNLIMNALDVTEGQKDAVISVTTAVDEDEVVIGVADNGPGIPAEVQRRIFEPFFTTKPSGTGLGLYSCRRIIEDEHGGTVQFDSRPGAGTKVWFRLPALLEGEKS